MITGHPDGDQVTELRRQLQESLGEGYTIERELGGGGMSHVFLAHDRALSRNVVVKVVGLHLAEGVSVDRFNREIMLVAGLQHPQIVGVLSAGETNGVPFFVMPYVEGQSLRERLGAGPLPVAEAVSVLRDVARALAYAHERGVVHRDVKPDNVLLSGGSAALTDFGVAKALGSATEAVPDEEGAAAALTRVGTSIGTPAYMAPEQAAGESDVDHRADLYALGITAYEMLAGTPPFHDRPTRALLAAHLTETPPPLPSKRGGLPAALVALIDRCLAKEPDERPASAREVVAALSDPSVVSGEVLSQTVPSGVRPAVRRRVVGTAVGVGLAAAIGWFVAGLVNPPAAFPERSIAVLPFVNVGGDTADAYFADGMTDELISGLQGVPGLQVASRTASFAHKGTTASVTEIGRALGVATLLEGTVRRGGNRMRLTAQLVSVTDGFAMWSETYEAETDDVFQVQDSIARAIVGALRGRIGGEALADLPEVPMRRGTDDLEAYDLYLRGRFFFAQRGRDGLERAAEYFRRAVERDSTFAAAYTGLADAYGLMPLYGAVPQDSVMPMALGAADRAIRLDSSLAAAWASRANLLTAGWRWEEADRDFRRAIALDPAYATAHQWLGELLLVRGHVEAAVEQLRRATELDPLSPVMAGSRATALGAMGRHEDAVELARRAVELGPGLVTRMMLGNALLNAGQVSEAIIELERAVDLAGPVAVPRGLLGYAYARQGQTRDASELLDQLLAAPDAPGHAVGIARIHLGLDRPDSAITWLVRAYRHRDPFFHSEGLASPIFDPLRRHPRFGELVERLNLERDRLVH